MICKRCGKEMIKVGTLMEEEIADFFYINEKFGIVNQALNSEVLKDIEFTDGQVFEYFKSCYDQLAQARYLQFIFERNIKRRLGISEEVFIEIEDVTYDIFIHPQENN